MHRTRWIAASLVLILAFAACGDEDVAGGPTAATGPTAETGATGPTDSSPSPSDPASPTESPSEEPQGELEDGRHFGYLRSVDPPGFALEFDLAEFYTGDEANEVAEERGEEVPVPNDYFIVNDNPRLRTLAVAPDVEVVLLDWNRCCDETFSPTLDEFAGALASARPTEIGGHLTYGAESQYWLTVEDGAVVRIQEQYLP